MTHEDKLARMYQIMTRLAEIEYERESILKARERKAALWLDPKSRATHKAWATRRANLAARRKAA